MSAFVLKENKAIDEKYYYMKHKSGLPIYVIPKNHTTGYAVFGTNFGSVDNRFKVNGKEHLLPDGIAHFLEHKLFENEDGIDTFKKYAEFGASANAYTSSDKTVYLFSATENMKESLGILLDFVTHPYFTNETVAKEQGIIGQEIRMYDDNPGWRLYFNMLTALYHNHPARIDTAGTVETIAQITPETLYLAYNTFYNLNNMALCVCGDMDPEEVLEVCDKYLKDAPTISPERIFPDEPETVFKKEVTQKLSVSMPVFSVGIKDVHQPCSGKTLAKKQAEYEIILELLFGKSSPFYTRLYEEGLINNAFSTGYEAHTNFGFCEISGYSNEPDKVYEQILAEIEKYKSSGFDKEDFERVKRVFYAANLRYFNSTEDIANEFITHVFRDFDMLEYPSVISEVTIDDVTHRFNQDFIKDRIVLSKVLPL
ncbi:MAG: insulinase family protein [Ruminococcaceae bacterium]|nr:insulinase family protein [Oscillospiraceae bacterium]